MDFPFFRKKTPSGEIARERLQLMLTHDRANCSPQLLEMIRSDILAVISKYVEIDETESDVQITQSEDNNPVPVLYANIAIKNMRKVRA